MRAPGRRCRAGRSSDASVFSSGAEAVSESRRVDSGTFNLPAAGEPPAEALTVTFRNRSRPCPFKRGQTVCEAAEAGGVEISADYHAGICGSDPVRIVSGAGRLNPMSGAERERRPDRSPAVSSGTLTQCSRAAAVPNAVQGPVEHRQPPLVRDVRLGVTHQALELLTRRFDIGPVDHADTAAASRPTPESRPRSP